MNVPGFTLLLQEFCSYCPDFEPEVEKIDCSSLTEQVKYCTNIRCTQTATAVFHTDPLLPGRNSLIIQWKTAIMGVD